jgi:hypothetical protein
VGETVKKVIHGYYAQLSQAYGYYSVMGSGGAVQLLISVDP